MPIMRIQGCGKKRFRDHQEAVRALHRAQNARKWAAIDNIPTQRGEVRCYECDDCHGVHLTSLHEWTLSA